MNVFMVFIECHENDMSNSCSHEFGFWTILRLSFQFELESPFSLDQKKTKWPKTWGKIAEKSLSDLKWFILWLLLSQRLPIISSMSHLLSAAPLKVVLVLDFCGCAFGICTWNNNHIPQARIFPLNKCLVPSISINFLSHFSAFHSDALFNPFNRVFKYIPL